MLKKLTGQMTKQVTLPCYFLLTPTRNFPPSCMTSVMTSIFTLSIFHLLSSNIPSGPSYGVYISQLIRYARCCTYYEDFGYRHKLLVDRVLSQGYKTNCLRNSFKKLMAGIQIS